MKKTSTLRSSSTCFLVPIALLGILGLAACSNFLQHGSSQVRSSASDFLVSVTWGGAGSKTSKDLINDTGVKSVSVSVSDAAGNPVGSGGTLSNLGTYWGGSISVPGSGFLTFAATAYNSFDSSGIKLYYGEARQAISGNGDHVSIGVTTPASIVAMVDIPIGIFTMGDSTNGTFTCVLSAPFRMSKYDITQGQYKAITGINPSTFSGNSDAVSCPVEQVTWYDAVEFCNGLSAHDGLTPVYTISGRTPSSGYPITNATVTATWTNNGYRLPTEAQWEYAARGNTTTTYYWGNAGDDSTVGLYAWFNGNSSSTHAVGQKQANAFGLYDMAGNVWQWCWDWYGAYPTTMQSDPTGAPSGTNKIWRGGNWSTTSAYLTSAERYVGAPGSRYMTVGFRVVAP